MTDPGSDLLVAGIGMSLRGDDSAGPQAVALWRDRRRSRGLPPIKTICLEAPGLELLDALDGARKVVLVDAVMSGAAPGTLHRISADELDAFGTDGRSAHGWGLGETLAITRTLAPERLPDMLAIVGIEAGTLEPGPELSPEVAAALAGAADLIEDIVKAALACQVRATA
jgi:hydrogenase maturation protease